MGRRLCSLLLLLLPALGVDVVQAQHLDTSSLRRTSSSIPRRRVRGIDENVTRGLKGKGDVTDNSGITISAVGGSSPKGKDEDGDLEVEEEPDEDDKPTEAPVTGAPTAAPSFTLTPAPSMSFSVTTIVPSEEEPLTTEPPTAVPTGSITLSPSEQLSSTTDPEPGTDDEEVASLARALLPFSLELSGQVQSDEADEALELYLFGRFVEEFDTLDSIQLEVASMERRMMRRRLQEQVFDFSGSAVFVDSEVPPTESEVHRAQLAALQDLQALNDFIKEQGYGWEVLTTISDEMVVAGTNPDTIERGNFANAKEDDSNNNAAVVSLSFVAGVAVLAIAGFLVQRKRQDIDDLSEIEQVAVQEKTVSHDLARNASQDTVTVTAVSFDSVNLAGGEYYPEPAKSSFDWGRVFALSRTPVEQTMKDVFEPKTLSSPKIEKKHQVVTLAPVEEVPSASQFQQELPSRGNEEDSYGYDSFPGDGIESFEVSSPMRAAAYSGNDHDITIDLAEFADVNEDDNSVDSE